MMWIVAVVLFALSFVIEVAGLVKLMSRWNFSVKPQIASRRRRSSSMSRKDQVKVSNREKIIQANAALGLDTEEVVLSRSLFRKPTNTSKASLRHEVLEWRRHRNYLVVLILLMLYSGSGLLLTVPYFFGRYRFEGNVYQNIAAATLAPGMLGGLWMVSNSWYQSLPELRHFQNLINLKSWLIRHPSFVGNFMATQVAAIVLVAIGTLFVGPLVDSSQETLRVLNTVFLGSLVFFLILYSGFFLALVIVLYRIIHRLIVSTNDVPSYNSNEELKAIYNSKTTIRIALVAILCFTPATALLLAAMAFTSLGSENMWLFFNGLCSIACLAAILVVYIIAQRLAGDKVERVSTGSSRDSRRTSNGSALMLKTIDDTTKETTQSEDEVFLRISTTPSESPNMSL